MLWLVSLFSFVSLVGSQPLPPTPFGALFAQIQAVDEQVRPKADPADPVVTLPKEITGDVSTFIIIVPAAVQGDDLSWLVLDAGLSLLPPELLQRHDMVVVMASKPGRYRLLAVTGSVVNGKAKLSPVAVCTVVVGDAPVPPDPKPPDPPVPPTPPTPIPVAGLHVLIVYDSANPGDAAKIFNNGTVRNYMFDKCAKGPDGKNPEYRVVDKDANMANAPKFWQDLMARPRQSLPWIIIANTSAGYEGPLPSTVEATMTLLKKFGG